VNKGNRAIKIFVAGLIALFGCSITYAELDYRGVLPSSREADPSIVDALFSELSSKASLGMIGEPQTIGVPNAEPEYIITAATQSGEKVTVNITLYLKDKMIIVQIFGKAGSTRAKEIGGYAQWIYDKQIPGSKLSIFERTRSLLAPGP